MAEGRDVAESISRLADPDATKRRAAARQLYLAGAALCLAATRGWFRDAEFCELVGPPSVDATVKSGPDNIPFSIGVAVRPENFQKIRIANGAPRLADVPPDQDAMEFELRFGDGEDFDILTARDTDGAGAIARYLMKFGEGIQQIEIGVTSVNRATDILRTRFGITSVYPEAHAGADGTRVNFFLVPVAEGRRVLIELVEAAPKK